MFSKVSSQQTFMSISVYFWRGNSYFFKIQIQIVILPSNHSVCTLVTFQKSSLPSIAPPCECLNVGFQNCMLNPAGFCNCSAGCSFVQNFLTEAEKNATAIYDNVEMVTMRSYSGIMTPVNGEGSVMTPALLQDSLQVVFNAVQNSTSQKSFFSSPFFLSCF